MTKTDSVPERQHEKVLKMLMLDGWVSHWQGLKHAGEEYEVINVAG